MVNIWRNTELSFFFHLQNKTNTRDSRISLARAMSTMQTQMPGSLPDYQIDPYRLIEDDLKDIFDDIQLVMLFTTFYIQFNFIRKFSSSLFFLFGEVNSINFDNISYFFFILSISKMKLICALSKIRIIREASEFSFVKFSQISAPVIIT